MIEARTTRGSAVGHGLGWFFNYDCGAVCGTNITSTEFYVGHGSVHDDGAVSVGLGLDGTTPHVEIYLQPRPESQHTWGLGGRLGLGTPGIFSLIGRYDYRLNPSMAVLYNPTVGVAGANYGSFTFSSHSLGLEIGDGPLRFAPYASFVFARGSRTHFDNEISFVERFATVGAGVRWYQSQ